MAASYASGDPYILSFWALWPRPRLAFPLGTGALSCSIFLLSWIGIPHTLASMIWPVVGLLLLMGRFRLSTS